MAKRVGTWIYYNKDGDQLSKIQHNQVVRQNNAFTLFVAFDSSWSESDETEIVPGFKAKDTKMEAYIRKPSDSEYDSEPSSSVQGYDLIKFEKLSPTEMTYGLKDGEHYIVYALDFSASSGATNQYGNINVDLKIWRAGEDEEKFSLGVVDIYVQPTYNTQNEEKSDIEKVYDRLNDKIEEINGNAYNINIYSDEEKYGTKVIIDGKIDTTKAEFSQLTDDENEDLRPATVGFVEKHADEKIGHIIKPTVKEEIDDVARILQTNITNVDNKFANYDTSEVVNSKIDSAILQADHVTEISALTKDELQNNPKKVGFKYKTDKDDTNFKSSVVLDLDDRVALKSNIDDKVGELNTNINQKLDTYKVKTLQNGTDNDKSETGYAKFHYNETQTVKAKMPSNMIYFTESETEEGEPVDTSMAERAILDSLGQKIVSTYTKDLKIALSNDVLSIESITGEDRAKGNSVNVSLSDYAKKINIPTKLDQLVGDEENRTVTDAEKEEWNKKQVYKLFSINIYEDFEDLPAPTILHVGKVLVAKNNGNLPLTMYEKPIQGMSGWQKVDTVKTSYLYICNQKVYTFTETEPYFLEVNSEKVDLSNYVTKNELQEYSLKTQTGNSIELDLKNGDLTIILKDVDGKQLDSSTVSLDRDQVITGGEYADGKIILSLQDGTTIEIPVEDMVSGLATTTQVETLSTNLNKEINSLKSGKANDADLKAVAKEGTFASLNEKPTTLSGYGITDAYIDGDEENQQIIRLGDKVITPLTSVTYEVVGNKPKLNTTHINSLTTKEAEIVNGSIDLHKVSKTGSYNDLNDKPDLFSKSYNDLTDKPILFSEKYTDLTEKPILNTTNSNSLSSTTETINGEINLHKVAKTGSSTDLVDYDNLVKAEQLNEVKNSKMDKPSNNDLAQQGQVLIHGGKNTAPTWGDVTVSGTMSLVASGKSISSADISQSYSKWPILLDNLTQEEAYSIYEIYFSVDNNVSGRFKSGGSLQEIHAGEEGFEISGMRFVIDSSGGKYAIRVCPFRMKSDGTMSKVSGYVDALYRVTIR